MPHLVALAMPAGMQFVDEMRRAWDAGHAVLPVDLRLPEAMVEALLRRLGAAEVVDRHGDRTRLDCGVPVEPGDALVMATSGTTGDPKGVVLTHAAIEASSLASSRRLGIDPARHRWLACLPFAHVGGLSVVLRALHTGTPFDVLPGFDANAVEAAAARGATHVSLVATALRRIDPSVFVRILLGGSRPPDDVPPNCTVTYGMTETASGIWYDDRPLDGVEVEVRPSPADGHAGDLPGEIHVRGPMLLRCYRDGTDPKTADGWLPTGDLGELTDDGRLIVHGRRGDMIVTGGENVWPSVVEDVLARHPAVREVMVVGEPDTEWGQVVTAVVVPTDPADPPTLDVLRGFARDQLPPYALPRALRIDRSLPRTALGKLRRPRASHV
ncbi:MAG TPA: AMP-binding protein [Acidimicrobiales bacterium]